jgi:hypothetical protein
MRNTLWLRIVRRRRRNPAKDGKGTGGREAKQHYQGTQGTPPTH